MNDGATPVFIASARGHHEIVGMLASFGGDVNTPRRDCGWTQFYVDKFGVNPTDGAGWTPLMIAAWNGHVEVVAALLRAGASPKVALPGGKTALSLAKSQGHADIVALFEKA
jgi:ankyrin repeat protein